MSDVPFYRTQMGHRYYEHTLPELARQLGRVADLLDRFVVLLERNGDASTHVDVTNPPR